MPYKTMSTPLPLVAGRPGNHAGPAAAFDLLGTTAEELSSWLMAAGQPRYRAGQILEWIYRHNAESFEQMSNLPRALRDWLAQRAALYRTTVLDEARSGDGTCKLLLSLPDGASVESVLIRAGERNTACLSSQVGCPVGCRFCASGLEGLERNLTAGEIVEQALRIRRLVEGDGSQSAAVRRGERPRLSNIVMMGMGEPLANYREVLRALRILNAPWGLGIGARKITVSTVGLPSQIRRLAHEDLAVNLALSLHAPDEELRRELIPWGRGVRLADLLEACRYYFQQTGREVTLEYVLLEGVNNLPRHAVRLAAIARQIRANVNLLRYNPVPGLPYVRPSAESAFEFQRLLRERGVNVHIRTSRGQDVQAACGQLRRAGAPGPAGPLPMPDST
jgi:23S rRNA (adenine2503-C2)-methyltransferase